MFNLTFFVTSIMLGLGLAVDGFLISLSNGLSFNKTTLLKTLISATTFALFQLAAVLLGWFCVENLINNFNILEDIVSILALIILCFLGIKMIVNGAKSYVKNKRLHNTMQFKQSKCGCQSLIKNNINKHVNRSKRNYVSIIKQTNRNLKLIYVNSLENFVMLTTLNNIKTQKKHKKKVGWLLTLLLQGFITSLDALSVGFVLSSSVFVQALITAIIIAGFTFMLYLLGFYLGKKLGNKLATIAHIVGGIVLIIIGLEIFISGLIK